MCGYNGKFLSAGRPPRYDAKCPKCVSVERHRLLVLANRGRRLIPDDASLLHFAPEPALSRYLRGTVARYRSADIVPGKAELVLNAEELDLPNESYDVIVASHVLEHVDDHRALREFARVLTPRGKMIAMFPIVEAWQATYERSDIVDERERLLHFGQEDHVRFYGRDVRDRITAAGLLLDEITGTPEECIQYGLARGETIFVGTKP